MYHIFFKKHLVCPAEIISFLTLTTAVAASTAERKPTTLPARFGMIDGTADKACLFSLLLNLLKAVFIYISKAEPIRMET